MMKYIICASFMLLVYGAMPAQECSKCPAFGSEPTLWVGSACKPRRIEEWLQVKIDFFWKNRHLSAKQREKLESDPQLKQKYEAFQQWLAEKSAEPVKTDYDDPMPPRKKTSGMLSKAEWSA